jgi:DNA-directed RNA polymerase specialized sigma24 family protein
VDRESALRLIPTVYAVALRLYDAGMRDHELAHTLGLEDEAVGPLLRLAEDKLREAQQGAGSPRGPGE